jgi:hypothetical protein
MEKIQFRRSLKKLLDYCEPDEERHYEECGKAEKSSHIIHSIRYLRKELNNENVKKVRPE